MGGNARLPSPQFPHPFLLSPHNSGGKGLSQPHFQKNKLRLKRNDLRFAVSKGWKWDFEPRSCPQTLSLWGTEGETQRGAERREAGKRVRLLSAHSCS